METAIPPDLANEQAAFEVNAAQQQVSPQNILNKAATKSSLALKTRRRFGKFQTGVWKRRLCC